MLLHKFGSRFHQVQCLSVFYIVELRVKMKVARGRNKFPLSRLEFKKTKQGLICFPKDSSTRINITQTIEVDLTSVKYFNFVHVVSNCHSLSSQETGSSVMNQFVTKCLEHQLVEIRNPINFLQTYDISFTLTDFCNHSRSPKLKVKDVFCCMRKIVLKRQSISKYIVSHHMEDSILIKL